MADAPVPTPATVADPAYIALQLRLSELETTKTDAEKKAADAEALRLRTQADLDLERTRNIEARSEETRSAERTAQAQAATEMVAAKANSHRTIFRLKTREDDKKPTEKPELPEFFTHYKSAFMHHHETNLNSHTLRRGCSSRLPSEIPKVTCAFGIICPLLCYTLTYCQDTAFMPNRVEFGTTGRELIATKAALKTLERKDYLIPWDELLPALHMLAQVLKCISEDNQLHRNFLLFMNTIVVRYCVKSYPALLLYTIKTVKLISNALSNEPPRKPGKFHEFNVPRMHECESALGVIPDSYLRNSTNAEALWPKIVATTDIPTSTYLQSIELSRAVAKGDLLVGVIPKGLIFQNDKLPDGSAVPTLPLAALPNNNAQTHINSFSNNNNSGGGNARFGGGSNSGGGGQGQGFNNSNANRGGGRPGPGAGAANNGQQGPTTPVSYINKYCPPCGRTFQTEAEGHDWPTGLATVSASRDKTVLVAALSASSIIATAPDAAPETTKAERVPTANTSRSNSSKSSSRRGRSKLPHTVPTSTRHAPPPTSLPTYDGYFSPNPLPTTPSESAFQALNNIYTSLDATAFSAGIDRLLPKGHKLTAEQEERWRRVPTMITEGSTLGIQSVVSIRSIPPNAPMTAEQEKVIDDKFGGDLAKRQLSGPYTIEALEAAAGTPIRTAPMGVVPKGVHIPPPPVKKWPIIENLSAPRKPRGEISSVNSGLDSSYEICEWSSTGELERRFLGYGPEVEVMGIDLVEGFMHIPVHPWARPHFCLSSRGGIYVRKVASYGARTTPAIFGNCVDLTIAIMELDLPVQAVNQVDDIAVARTSSDVKDSDVRDFLRHLGWKVHPFEAEKGFTWSRIFTFNGIVWDLDSFTKTLSDDKRLKYLAFATELHKVGRASRSDMDKLLGYLIYVCWIVVRHRKSFLWQLFSFRRGFRPEDKLRSLLCIHRHSIREWISFLKTPFIRSTFEKPQVEFPTKIFTDASNYGIGVVAGPFAASFILDSDWRTKYDAHIGPAEFWGVESGLEAALKLGAANCRLEIFCDNNGVVFSWRKGWSRNHLQNESIARVFELTMRFNILLTITYVNTTLNLADPLSREKPAWPPGLQPFPYPLDHPRGTLFYRNTTL
ncbi:hypothetical protein P7C70_g7719, partial [Phenoliferia sp. Uapishka_3]